MMGLMRKHDRFVNIIMIKLDIFMIIMIKDDLYIHIH